MRVIDANNLEEKVKFSMLFKQKEDDILIVNGEKKISAKDILNKIRVKYSSKFRGAIVYSEKTFRNNLKETHKILSKYFGDDYKLLWAVKSAPIKGLVAIAADEKVGFDVGSHEELMMAKKCNVNGAQIYHTASGKFDWDIEAIVNHDCVCISDNLTELNLVNEIAKKSNKKITIGIRINPSVDASTKKEISTGRLDCKFGIPEISDDFFSQLKSLKNVAVKILHMHIGSQIGSPEDYEKAAESMINVLKKFKSHGFNIDTLDIGGGFPYNYSSASISEHDDKHAFCNQARFSFENYISKVKQLLESMLGKNIPCIAFEPGRHIAAGAAFALGYVLNTKKYPNGLQWIMSSINVNDLWHKELLPDTYFDVHVLSEKNSDKIPSAIAGTLCFSGDILTPSNLAVNLNKNIKRGDIIFYNNVGAYCLLGSGNFHNMPRVPIFMVDTDGALKELRGQEKTYFDE